MIDGKAVGTQNYIDDLLPKYNPLDDRKFKCTFPTCYGKFRTIAHLKRHWLKHTKEKNHMCTYPGCEQMFSRKDNMKTHMKTHIKNPITIDNLNRYNRPFKIELKCERNFSQNLNSVKLPPASELIRQVDLYWSSNTSSNGTTSPYYI